MIAARWGVGSDPVVVKNAVVVVKNVVVVVKNVVVVVKNGEVHFF